MSERDVEALASAAPAIAAAVSASLEGASDAWRARLGWHAAWGAVRFAQLVRGGAFGGVRAGLPGVRGVLRGPARDGADTLADAAGVPAAMHVDDASPAWLARLVLAGVRTLEIGDAARGVADAMRGPLAAHLEKSHLVERREPGAPALTPRTLDVFVAPFLHEARDLARIADHVVADVALPPPGVGGVRLVVRADWPQRRALQAALEERLEATGGAARGHAFEPDREDGAPVRRGVIREHPLACVDTEAYFSGAAALAAGRTEPAAALVAFVYPMLRERHAIDALVSDLVTAHPATLAVFQRGASFALASQPGAWGDGERFGPGVGEALARIEAPFVSPFDSVSALTRRVEHARTGRPALRLAATDAIARF